MARTLFSIRLPLILAFCLSTAAHGDGVPTTSDLLSALNLEFSGSEKATLIDHSEAKGTELRLNSIIFSARDVRIQIEARDPVEKSEADRLSESEFAVLNSLYSPRQTPYMGEVSQIINCAEQDRPKTFKTDFLGHESRALLATAGERYSFGVCERDLIAFRGLFFSAYDPAHRRLFEIRMFVPSSKSRAQSMKIFQDTIRRFRGRKP